MQKLFTYLLLILLLTSCEEQTDWDLHAGKNEFIVVDGIITDQWKVQSIILSKPVAAINLQPQPVSGATILVSTDQKVYTFHEDATKPGFYLSDTAFAGISGKTYSLLITNDNQTYSSKAILAAPEDFDFLTCQKNEDDTQYRITSVAKNFNPRSPAMYEIQLDWTTVVGFKNADPDSCRARLFYYTLPTIDVSEVFAPGMEKVVFPLGTVITERRYSLTPEHAAFLRAILLETTWQGGFFNTASANVPTNLSNGALGFFGACGVVEKQGVVN
jgi:hypothetical protein